MWAVQVWVEGFTVVRSCRVLCVSGLNGVFGSLGFGLGFAG